MKTLEQYLNSTNPYAIGAYNFFNYETLRGVCEGCKQTKSPAFLAVSESSIAFLGEEFLIGLVQSAKKAYNLPLFLHLDHGKTFEICKKAIMLGFDSVMFDGSALPFEENVQTTKKIVTLAHKHGVFVEAELGQLTGVEDGTKTTFGAFTNPAQAKEFVERTGCDSLAVAIGTSHGAYKFKKDTVIRFDILEEIEKAIPNTPLVLHGASSVPQEFVKIINKNGGKIVGAKGTDSQILQKLAKHHIFKINTDTDLRLCSTACMRQSLKENPSNFDMRKPNSKIIEEIAKFVAEKNKILGCEKKA